MKFLFLLSIKNLFRYKKRTFITASAIAFGIAMALFTDGILRWADNDSIRNLLHFETGSIRIANKEYFNDAQYFPLKKTLPHSSEIEQILLKEKLSYSKEIHFLSSVVNPLSGESYHFVGIGISPKQLKQVYQFQTHIVSGHFLYTKSQSIFISAYLSDLLDVQVGEELIIEAKTVNDMHNADSFIVSGIFDCPNPAVNKKNYFISFDSADRLLDMNHKFTIMTIQEPKNKSVVKKLQKLISFRDVVVLRWQDLSKDYLALSKTKQSSTKALLFFIFIIVAVGIVNTMLMAIFERRKEIAMMRSLGMQKKEIIINFIFESAGLGFIGSTIGVILGTIINEIFAIYGIDYSFLGDMDYGYRVPAVFHTEIYIPMIIFVFCFGIGISILVSLYPAYKASSENIVNGLRD